MMPSLPRRVMERYHDTWLDQPVPALGGITANTFKGRQRLTGLIREMKHCGGREQTSGKTHYDWKGLR